MLSFFLMIPNSTCTTTDAHFLQQLYFTYKYKHLYQHYLGAFLYNWVCKNWCLSWYELRYEQIKKSSTHACKLFIFVILCFAVFSSIKGGKSWHVFDSIINIALSMSKLYYYFHSLKSLQRLAQLLDTIIRWEVVCSSCQANWSLLFSNSKWNIKGQKEIFDLRGAKILTDSFSYTRLFVR